MLYVKSKDVNQEVYIAAARAISQTIEDDELDEEYIIPSVFNKSVVSSVSEAVKKAATKNKISKE